MPLAPRAAVLVEQALGVRDLFTALQHILQLFGLRVHNTLTANRCADGIRSNLHLFLMCSLRAVCISHVHITHTSRNSLIWRIHEGQGKEDRPLPPSPMLTLCVHNTNSGRKEETCFLLLQTSVNSETDTVLAQVRKFHTILNKMYHAA